MTRYVVLTGGFYVAAVHIDTRHLWLTKEKDDAGTWPAYEGAVKAARFVADTTKQSAFVHAVQDSDG